MKTLKTIITASLSLGFASVLHAGLEESATLNADITTGGLEIVPASVNQTFTPVGGAVSITGQLQEDALQFQIDNVTINDLDGNGSGWTLTASPALTLVNGPDTLPLGTQDGFNNPSDDPNTSGEGTNTVTYSAGGGVVGYTIDYDVAYDVPALVPAGQYSGTVTFTLASL